MIVDASRKTDIPSYYSNWFLKRIKAGFFYIRHPMDFHQISKISLSPETVDGIVFWTKNPTPMLDKLDTLITCTTSNLQSIVINSYSVAIERNLPRKNKVIIPAFQRLSDLIGPDRVVWRYDPIFQKVPRLKREPVPISEQVPLESLIADIFLLLYKIKI